jgi:hypothetical protein
MAVGRLAGGSRKKAKPSLTALAAILESGELVECVVAGRFNGVDGVGALTSKRVLLVNDREWKPDVADFPVDGSITIQGWQDNRTAALVIQRAESSGTIDHIDDRAIAIEFAQRLRSRAATG